MNKVGVLDFLTCSIVDASLKLYPMRFLLNKVAVGKIIAGGI